MNTNRVLSMFGKFVKRLKLCNRNDKLPFYSTINIHNGMFAFTHRM